MGVPEISSCGDFRTQTKNTHQISGICCFSNTGVANEEAVAESAKYESCKGQTIT